MLRKTEITMTKLAGPGVLMGLSVLMLAGCQQAGPNRVWTLVFLAIWAVFRAFVARGE
jgi:hypothetical protein